MMKNTISKTIGFAMVAIYMFAMQGQTSAFGQDTTKEIQNDGQNQEDLLARRQNTRKLEGSWNNQGTRLNCQTGAVLGTFQAMLTFARGGVMWEAGSQVSPALRSPSNGVWYYESGRNYDAAFQFFRFNADGTFAGRQIVRQEIQLSQDGNSYTAQSTAQVLDVNGNVIQNNCASGIGTRFE
jgi:hypothetical protein